jgi:hypothetical protein
MNILRILDDLKILERLDYKTYIQKANVLFIINYIIQSLMFSELKEFKVFGGEHF